MSQWTHVCGCVRFDGIKGMTPDPDMGISVDFNSPPERFQRCNVPCGSEGSLQHYSVEGHPSSAARFATMIWGDLRDYDNVEEIIHYLDRIVGGHAIRSGIVEIYVEDIVDKVVRYSRDSTRWEVIWEGVPLWEA